MMCLVSPCDRNATCSRSPCAVRVGRPVDGPTRCTSKIDRGRLGVVGRGRRTRPSAKYRGRAVDVIDARPRPARADHHAERRNLVLGLDDREGGLPVALSTRYFFMYPMSDSHSDDDGVIGYQATTVTPAIMQPMAAAALPSRRILPWRFRASPR